MQFTWTIGRRLIAGFGAALVLLSVVGLISYRNAGAMRDTSHMVTHTYEVLAAVETSRAPSRTPRRGSAATC